MSVCGNNNLLFSAPRCLDGLITTQAEPYLEAILEGWWADIWCAGMLVLLRRRDWQEVALKRVREEDDEEGRGQDRLHNNSSVQPGLSLTRRTLYNEMDAADSVVIRWFEGVLLCFVSMPMVPMCSCVWMCGPINLTSTRSIPYD